MKTVWGSDCVDGVRAVKNAEEIEIMKHASVIMIQLWKELLISSKKV